MLAKKYSKAAVRNFAFFIDYAISTPFTIAQSITHSAYEPGFA
jgi:hypothetical protein